jgi:hypothetical protein
MYRFLTILPYTITNSQIRINTFKKKLLLIQIPTWANMQCSGQIRIRKFLGLPDPDPLVRGTGTYRSGSGSFHHQAKIVKKKLLFLLFCEKSRIRIRWSELRIRGSVPKCQGSGTLLICQQCARKYSYLYTVTDKIYKPAYGSEPAVC